VHRFQGGEVHSFHPLTINALVDGRRCIGFRGECIGFRGEGA
jgi:hypothetical protein